MKMMMMMMLMMMMTMMMMMMMMIIRIIIRITSRCTCGRVTTSVAEETSACCRYGGASDQTKSRN
jgi:hypothetical protein